MNERERKAYEFGIKESKKQFEICNENPAVCAEKLAKHYCYGHEKGYLMNICEDGTSKGIREAKSGKRMKKESIPIQERLGID